MLWSVSRHDSTRGGSLPHCGGSFLLPVGYMVWNRRLQKHLPLGSAFFVAAPERLPKICSIRRIGWELRRLAIVTSLWKAVPGRDVDACEIPCLLKPREVKRAGKFKYQPGEAVTKNNWHPQGLFWKLVTKDSGEPFGNHYWATGSWSSYSQP